MNMSVEHGYVVLSAKMAMERGMQKELLKKHVGQPKKELELVLLPQQMEEEECPSKKKLKVRGSYTNWFILFL